MKPLKLTFEDWKFRDKKQAVILGVRFGWPLEQYKLDTIPEDGFGHAMYAIGWDEDGLIIVNSAGMRAGKQGVHRITREVINVFVPIYGAMMMVDLPVAQVKYMLDNNIREKNSWLTQLFKTVINLFK